MTSPDNSAASDRSPAAPVATRASRRRTNAMHGFVNFPVYDLELTSSREGGMFVKLVVVDDRDYDDSDWNICCGAAVYDRLSEQLVGDDVQAPPLLDMRSVGSNPEAALSLLDGHHKAMQAWEARHFPNLHSADTDVEETRYTSRPYVASLLLGITGWSGYSEKADGYWHCTVDDLTPAGKVLYEQFKVLYAGCSLHLLTFLDT